MGQAALEMEAALVQLRSGAIELLELATRDSRTKTAIISVSWSARFIREVLNQVDGLVPVMDRITIIANEFETNDVGATTGKIRGGIHTGQQKLSAMIQFLNQHQDQSESLPLHRSPHIIYVGDSVLDLPCIMASKSGFLLQPQLGMGSAQTLCDKAGIKTQPLHSNKAISGNEKENKVVIVVQSLDHVVAALRDSS
jgi:phosphoserine phosphatase